MKKAGILMPVFSLPGKYGIGTLGEEAYRFIDLLCETGNKIWQILPMGPTGFGDSPYQAFSAFAGIWSRSSSRATMPSRPNAAVAIHSNCVFIVFPP